jgi:hypothetical protein
LICDRSDNNYPFSGVHAVSGLEVSQSVTLLSQSCDLIDGVVQP